MNIFNIISFILLIIFSIICLRLLLKPVVYLKYPFNDKYLVPLTGIQQLLLFILVTGLLRFGGFLSFIVLDISAIKLFCLIIVSVLGIFLVRTPVYRSYPLLFYSLYLLWLLFCLYESPTKGYGLRVFLKYFFPFSIFILAMKSQVQEMTVLKFLDVLIKVTVIYCLIYLTKIVDAIQFLLCTYATFGDYISVMVIVALSLYYLTKKKIYLFLIAFFLLFSFINLIRTSLVATTVGLVVFYFIKYRLKALPVIFGILIIFVLVLFYSPSLRSKTFKKQMTIEEVFEMEGGMSIDDINTNARQAMWEWALKNFYEPNKITGKGLGYLQYVFYDTDHPFKPLPTIHNDYVQILCDSGLVGFSLFVLILISMIWHSLIIYHNKQNNEILKMMALISASSLAAIMTCSITDNTVNFVSASYCYPFVFYGITLFLLQKRNYSAE